MNRQESHRLKRILEYNKGYADALAFVLDDNPTIEKMDLKLEMVQDKIKDLERKLKGKISENITSKQIEKEAKCYAELTESDYSYDDFLAGANYVLQELKNY